MASYLTEAMIAGRLKESFDRLYDLTERDDLAQDIAAVEARVNSYVGRRYQVPVADSAAKAVVVAIALDLAEEVAWRRAGGDEIPKKVKDAADIARRDLEAIATGKMTLAGASPAENDTGGAGAILIDGNDPEFTREQLQGF